MDWKEVKSSDDLPKDSELYWITLVSEVGGVFVYIAMYNSCELNWRLMPTGVIIEEQDRVLAYQPYLVPEPFKNNVLL